MTERNFRQHALGFGPIPSQVICQIDGNTVFSGAVTTMDQPMPSMPNSAYVVDNVAWTWQDDIDFTGTRSLNISVTGSPLLLAITVAEDCYSPGVWIPTRVVQLSETAYADPFSDETLDGVALVNPDRGELAGQWWWQIPAGSTFTATMHVQGRAAANGNIAPPQ